MLLSSPDASLPTTRHVSEILADYRAQVASLESLRIEQLQVRRHLLTAATTSTETDAARERLAVLAAAIEAATHHLNLFALELRYASTF